MRVLYPSFIYIHTSSVIVEDYDKAEFYYGKLLKEEFESADDFELVYIRYEQPNSTESSEYNQKAYELFSKLSKQILF